MLNSETLFLASHRDFRKTQECDFSWKRRRKIASESDPGSNLTNI